MFTGFFYFLREKGMKVGLSEWLGLIEAMDKGLIHADFTEFYLVSRMLLVRNEYEFDKYDTIFEEYFKGIKDQSDDISEQMRKWLEKPEYRAYMEDLEKKKALMEEEGIPIVDNEDVLRKFRERQKEQDAEHQGGNQWIGTAGNSSYGNLGGHLGGVRVGGTTGYQSAFQVIGERKFRDFRNDRVLDNRQFQMALRSLRQFSTRLDIDRTELDIDGTIDSTCNNGGHLKIEMQKPRKNTVKLLMLMDSGGTMIPYTNLLTELFQSVNKSNHFKDIKTYFFHNCIYSHVYKTPECEYGDWIDTNWILKNLNSEYKVIIVGDAAMAPEELYSPTGNYRGPNDGYSGMEWLQMLKKHFKRIIWLNPKMAPGSAPWREAETAVKNTFSMYRLTVEGLKEGMKYLMLSR
ncbi:MAG: VWA containing CoxE family protein [Lachnospiraceae bacterium]|nr:VWA containing CoxE family protein [Lachnospiraceae bacterium]